MIEAYLSGSIRQSLERVRQLRGIVQGSYPREYDGLRQLCLTKLDRAQLELSALAGERLVDRAIQTPRRVRALKRLVEHLNNVEGIGVFALSRASEEDKFLNRLITEVCSEIAYPLVFPVVSSMSQDYFHIYSEFNLLCLPLIESRFLLHLPDVYHELCHPLHRAMESPAMDGYQRAFKKSLFGMVAHFDNEMLAAERLRNQQARLFQLQLWRTCWTKYWMEEFFCDLFGVLSAGPAYAWSHYHLCIKRGSDPYDTPLMFEASHPADDARMGAILMMLRTEPAYRDEADRIAAAWRQFVTTMSYVPQPEYFACYPADEIHKLVMAAKAGVAAIGIQIARPGGSGGLRAMLNKAWTEFWRAPHDYQAWETARVVELRARVGT
jgi:hypothetical protein